MLAAFHDVQGVDGGDAGVGIQVHGVQHPAVLLSLAQLGGGAEAHGGIGLAGSADSLGALVGGGAEDGLVVMQALEELEAGVLAAVGQDQVLTVQFLISGSQLVRLLAHAEAGDPGAPGQVVQRILHGDLTLPLGLGQLPDVGDGRAVGIRLGVVEQLGQLDVHGGGGGGEGGINVLKDVGGLEVVEDLVGHILFVHGAVLVLDMDHVGALHAGLILAGDLFQQLIGGDIKGHALQAGILGHEGVGDLAAAGGDGVQRHSGALLQGLLVQLLIGLVGVVDTGTLLPIRQLGFRGSFGGGLSRGLGGGLLAAAAGGQAKEHDHRQKTCQPFLVLQHVLFLLVLLSKSYLMRHPPRRHIFYTQYLMRFSVLVSNTLIFLGLKPR